MTSKLPSSWPRRRRRFLQIAPLLLGFGALIAVLVAVASQLGGGRDAFFAALAGASLAVFGNLLIQYLVLLAGEGRAQGERQRRELGVIAAITIELMDGVVAFQADHELNAFREAPTSTWDALKLQVGEIYAPKTVLEFAHIYFRTRLLNEKFARRRRREPTRLQ